MTPEVGGESQEGNAGQNPWIDYLAKGGLLLGVTLVTALLAAIGINQELLARLLRNDPVALSYAIWAAILGVAIPVIGYLFAGARAWRSKTTVDIEPGATDGRWMALKQWSRDPNRIKTTAATLGAIFLTIAAMDTIYYGVQSFGDREQPSVRAVVTGDGTNDNVKVIASAQSLKTTEHMYVRIIAFDESHTGEVDKACSNTLTEVPAGARVLYWGQSGPTDLKGTTATEVDVNVNRLEFPFICAHVIITDPKRVTIATAAPSAYAGSATCPPAPSVSESAPSASATESAANTAPSPRAATCSQVAPAMVVIRAGDRFSSLFMDLRNAPLTPAPTESTQPTTSGAAR
jgi:hypothetical protein